MLSRKKKLFDRMLHGIDLIKVGIYARLEVKYLPEHGETRALLLAAAVTNEIFSASPTTVEAKDFLELNKDLVHRKLADLQGDDEIREAATQALRVKAIIDMDDSPETSLSKMHHLEKMDELGILEAGGDTPTPDSFLEFAVRFYDASTTGT